MSYKERYAAAAKQWEKDRETFQGFSMERAFWDGYYKHKDSMSFSQRFKDRRTTTGLFSVGKANWEQARNKYQDDGWYKKWMDNYYGITAKPSTALVLRQRDTPASSQSCLLVQTALSTPAGSDNEEDYEDEMD